MTFQSVGKAFGLGFTAQQRLDLLRNDRSAEDPGEGIADRRLEAAFDPVCQTHLTAPSLCRRPRVACRSGHTAHRHVIGLSKKNVTNRSLRIE